MDDIRSLTHTVIATARHLVNIQFTGSPTDPNGSDGTAVYLTSEWSSALIPPPTDPTTQAVAAIYNAGPGVVNANCMARPAICRSPGRSERTSFRA